MTVFSWIVFIFIGLLSFLPVTRLSAFGVSKKYKYFKYTSITLSIWSTVLFLRYLVGEPYWIYYLTLAIFPIVFAATSLLFLSINRFVGNKRLPIMEMILIVLFILDTISAFTNAIHQQFIAIAPSQNITISAMHTAARGWMFNVHLVINYLMVIGIAYLVITKMYKDAKKDKDFLPFVLILVGLALAITLNTIHVYIKAFIIDPTYISFVIILSILYFLTAMRDLKVLTYFNNNNFIIDNLREMYVIVNQRNNVIDASNELIKTFDFCFDNEDISFDSFMEKMSKKAIIYSDSKEIQNGFHKEKLYLHMQEKEIKMPMFRYSGRLYMFYDETDTQKYINELDYVLSHDLMTNIYNRNYYEEIKRVVERSSSNYGLILFDLDGLKLRNDFLGHEAGDDFLFRFAKILLEITDDIDGRVPIRMGGDEFLLIVQNTTEEEIIDIINEISTIAEDEDPLVNIVFSHGYFVNDSKIIGIDKALARADQNMYETKKQNRIKKQEFEQYLIKITKGNGNGNGK